MKDKLKKIAKTSIFSVYEGYKLKKEEKQKNINQNNIVNKYLENHEIKKLQIGCGSNVLEGWLNTDLKWNSNVAYLDASKIFPFESNSFDYIYSEHIFEHLTIDQQVIMLKESYRILKKGGIMRIANPSTDFLQELFNNPDSKENKNYVDWGINNIPGLRSVHELVEDKNDHYIYIINNFFKAWGHKMIHNFSSLKNLSMQYGFVNIVQKEVGESEQIVFLNIEKHGTIIPEEINKLETLVIEMQKQ
jgi:predicted SAM-dependent methyltransferase